VAVTRRNLRRKQPQQQPPSWELLEEILEIVPQKRTLLEQP
jgi:hypothetical protein